MATSAKTKPDPFRFGWRYVRQAGTNGDTASVRVPLTPEDVLHPQENDQIPENTVQQRDRNYLFDVLQLRLAGRPGVRVLSDCLVDWGVADLRNHSPDLCAMENVGDPEHPCGIFSVVEEGARPILVIEIVSPDAHAPQIRNNDVEIKVREYYRAGVPLYVIVDQEREDGPRRLVGYRRGRRRFTQIALDDEGRLLLGPVGVWLGLRDEKAICFDAVTGEEILDVRGLEAARQQAEQGRQQAEQARASEVQAREQAEQARERAEQAREQAEQARASEVQARQQAEAALAAAQARLAELEAQAGRRRRRPPRGIGP